MFSKFAMQYYDKGLNVIPVNGKAAFLEDWQIYCEGRIPKDLFMQWISKYPKCNIGLPLGPYNNLCALDIDIIDPTQLKDALKRLPQSPLVKKGLKGETRFFVYNNEPRIKPHPLEILSNGNYTVLPPSIHPDNNKPYIWTSQIEVDEWHNLPYIDVDFCVEYAANLNNKDYKDTNIKPSNENRCGHNSHLKLSEMMIAAIHANDGLLDIAENLLEYDSEHNQKVSYFLCPSRKEFKTKDRITNALQFIMEGLKRHKIAVNVGQPSRVEIVETKQKEEKTYYKKHKLPKLRGIAQDIFQHIYDTSPIPRTHLSFASTLATMSLLLGNKIQYRGTLPNLYINMMAPSGSGKDRPLRFPVELLRAANLTELIGESTPASDTSIIMNLPSSKIRVDVIDEASYLFGAMAARDSYLSNMSNIYQKLYTSSGQYFQGKTAYKYKNSKDNPEGRLGECDNPYIVLLCAMTINDFRKHFRTDLMEKGLGGRFLYFADSEVKPVVEHSRAPIPKEVVYFAESMFPRTKEEINFSDCINEVKVTKQSENKIKEYMTHINKMKMDSDFDNPMMPVINRLGQFFIKMALIDAASVSWQNGIIKMGADSIDYSIKFLDSYLKNIENFIYHNMSDNINSQELNLIEEIIQSSGNEGIGLTGLGENYRMKKLGLLSRRKKELLQTLSDDGIIFKQATKYYHKQFVKVERT